MALPPDALTSPELAAAIAELRNARLVGLMAIGRATRRPAARLRAAARPAGRAGAAARQRSPGAVDGDERRPPDAAVDEGATLVRIGTALFGRRDDPDG